MLIAIREVNWRIASYPPNRPWIRRTCTGEATCAALGAGVLGGTQPTGTFSAGVHAYFPPIQLLAGQVAGGAVAVVQFGDRAVYRYDVLRAAGVEVEQLRGGGLRDEQVGALGSGGWLRMGLRRQERT